MINNNLINESYHDAIARLFPYKYSKSENNKIQIINIAFQVTDDCNLKCSYCYQINKGHNVMPLEVAEKFIDLLLENNLKTQQYIDTFSCDAVILEFIGGEPFLQTELIDQIIEYFLKQSILTNHPWQYNWRISISSNGTLYFTPQVQKFINKYKEHLSLSISIDGNKNLHDACRKFPDGSGSYDIAIKAAHHYRDIFGGILGSKMTLSPDNIQYTYEAVVNLIQEGYTSIYLNCVFEKGWTNEHATILYHQLIQLSDYLLLNDLEDKIYLSIFSETSFHPKLIDDTQNWCGGNGSMLALDYKGDIYPCIRYMESSLGTEVKPLKCGDIYNGFMADQETKENIIKLRQVNRITQSTQKCINCSIADGCAWCQAYNYQDSGGDFNHRATYICCMHKARALANCYYWNSIYWKHHEDKSFKLWLIDNEALEIISKEELEQLKLYQYLYILLRKE